MINFFQNGQNVVIQFTFLSFASKLWVLLQELGWKMQMKVHETFILHLMKVQRARRCRKPKSYKLGVLILFESFGVTPLQEMNSSFFSCCAYEKLLCVAKHFDV
jgi:hypothetical protein